MTWGGADVMAGGAAGVGLMHALLSIVVVVAVVVLARRLLRTDAPSTGDRAIDIARDRYAKGELSRDEFERMRRDLERRASG